eukprot:GFYU01061803.1.p1 GENE.GFYU01061803.1~~GFYU01061803.1.p1  ORF type:complete len:148 (+),score=25.57 GFYU01061803.1:62-505(+)
MHGATPVGMKSRGLSHRTSYEQVRQEEQPRENGGDSVPAKKKSEAYFEYNLRVAVFAVPCILLLLSFGGKLTTSCFVLGLMLTYLLDVVNLRESTFICFWVTIVITIVTLMISGGFLLRRSWFALFLLWNMHAFVILGGVWGSRSMS